MCLVFWDKKLLYLFAISMLNIDDIGFESDSLVSETYM